MTNRLAVTSAEFIRKIGHWQNEALRQPISITHHGRERLVLAAPDLFSLPGESDRDLHAELAATRAGCTVMLDNMLEGYFVLDSHGRIASANSTAENLLGISREKLQNRDVASSLPEPMASALSDRVRRVIETMRSETFTCSHGDRH